jgi:beta-glucosidase
MVAAYAEAGYIEPQPAFVQSGDMAAIAVPTDFLGVNYYTRAVISAAANTGTPESLPHPPGAEQTEMGWEVYPDGLYDLLTRLHADYAPAKQYVTENGASYSDGPGPGGRVHDERRIRYLHDHFAACKRAIDEGVPLAGFFVWTLMDNFEWAKGYTQRFGIVWTDYATQERIPKDSALWYRQVIKDNALNLERSLSGR